MNAWRPIETAPKDGTEVDLWVTFRSKNQNTSPDSNYRVCNAFWTADCGWCITVEGGDYAGEPSSIEFGGGTWWNETKATHWMLPPGPPSEHRSWDGQDQLG